MRFHYQIGMCDADHYLPLAQAAEAAGYHGVTVPDSLCYPEHADSRYPYNVDGSREFLDGVPFVESLIAVTAMAAVTERIRFATFVYKLAVRQIVGVAKQVQSIQVLSGGRFDFGVGISPWAEDFAVMQTSPEARGRRLDEQIEIFRGLEGGAYFGYSSALHDLPSCRMCPVPDSPTELLIGGHSDAALRRAAELGDGWMCAGAATPDLAGFIRRLGALRAEAGRAEQPFRVFAGSADGFSAEGLERLAQIGVTDLVVSFRDVYAREEDKPLDDKIAMLNWYAVEFVGGAV